VNFSELGLRSDIVKALDVIGFSEPTAIQQAAIPAVLTGADVFGRSVTGSGKTLAFGLPLIERGDGEDRRVQSIVIAPTRELAEQITEELRKVTNSLDRVKVTLLAGGMDMNRQIKALKSGIRIVVGTPGRICDHLRRRTLKTDGVTAVVLDEADEMLKMGFRAELEQILDSLPAVHQTLMFSATLPEEVQTLAKKYMKDPVRVEGDNMVTVDTVTQGYIFCKSTDKTTVLIDALKAVDTDKCVVFCNTRATVETLGASLTAAQINVRPLHGLMRQFERKRAIKDAKSYDGAVLVATDVAARGIDISGIEYVFNFDVPHEREFYIHRIGRTARAGKSGVAITLCATRVQQNKLLAYAASTNATLVPMSIVGGKLIETGAALEAVDQEWLTAAADGDVNLRLELERTRQERLAQAKSVDGMIENVLTALQRKPDHSELIEELRTFGYTDEELLSAALTLWLDSRAARERSKLDRASRPYGKKPARSGAGKPPAKSQKPSAKKPYAPKGGTKGGRKGK